MLTIYYSPRGVKEKFDIMRHGGLGPFRLVMRSSGFALSQLRRVHSEKNGSDTPHQTTMNKLCRESVARCRECLDHTPSAFARIIPTNLANTLKFHHCSPWYFSILVRRKIKLSRPITHRGFVGLRATWSSRSYFEVNIFSFLESAFGGGGDSLSCEPHRGGNQPSLVVPMAGC